MRAALFFSAALIAAPATFAQTSSQYQGGNATAVTDIEVGQANDAAATAVASGNAFTTSAENTDLAVANTQHMDGSAVALTDATVWDANGNIVATSAAVANGATADMRGATADIVTSQLAHGDASANTALVGGYALNGASSASASGNVGGLSTDHSDLRLLSDQEATGSVAASINADHDVVADQAVAGAIASANNLSVGGETSTIATDIRQTATGASVSANVDVYVGETTDVSGNATANANSAAVDNQWGYVNARVAQEATAEVTAESFVTLGGDFVGFASSGAYGVGNQALVSNVGADTVIDTLQVNGGDVSADAALNGEGGDAALASAAAYGNSVTGYVCTQCDTNVPSLEAHNNQINAGDVSSSARVTTLRANTAAASSTAIGNAATYSARPPGG
jgi:hypothetical protein